METRPDLPRLGPPRLTSPRRLFAGSVECAAAVALCIAGSAGIGDASMATRVVCVAVGVWLGYLGIGTSASAAAGRSVDTMFGVAVAWTTVIGVLAILAPILPLGEHVDSAKTLSQASFARPDLLSSHPFGTNALGLDLLSRVIWGARTSLAVSTVAVAAGTAVGGLIGMVAGFFGGRVDRVITVLTNVGLAFPPLVLLLALAAVLRKNDVGLAVALAVLVVPSTVRVSRANTFAYAQREFVQASRAMGATRRRQILREVMPNVAVPLVALAFVTLPLLIVAEASLSFLGLGVPAPHPSLGNMVAEGGNGVAESSPHIVLVPGLALFMTVFALNLIGRRAQNHWDRREGKL